MAYHGFWLSRPKDENTLFAEEPAGEEIEFSDLEPACL
jgi:hypothetical protein